MKSEFPFKLFLKEFIKLLEFWSRFESFPSGEVTVNFEFSAINTKP